jgi:hypothetical protein
LLWLSPAGPWLDDSVWFTRTRAAFPG